MAQQLVARIKRSSKYSHQSPAEGWFAIEIVNDFLMPVRGNGNNYRLTDLSLGVALDGGVIELANGKKIASEVAGLRQYT